MRDAHVTPGTVYVMRDGVRARNLNDGEDLSRGPAIYVHANDERSDDEIRASIERWTKP